MRDKFGLKFQIVDSEIFSQTQTQKRYPVGNNLHSPHHFYQQRRIQQEYQTGKATQKKSAFLGAFNIKR